MRTRRRRSKVQRSSVSLDANDYAALRSIAEGHRPPLPVRYVIEYAIVEFLRSRNGKRGAAVDVAALSTSKRARA